MTKKRILILRPFGLAQGKQAQDQNPKKRILTGDRPTGKLHLGHYVGSLKNRVELQDKYETFILVADYHALTTKPKKEEVARFDENIRDMVLDYLSVGLDPKKVIIYRQSYVPEVAELHLIFSMLVSVPRLQRVPTLKEQIKSLKIAQPSYGLLGYPVLQAADILMVKGELVPVGKDQKSHIELSREIAKTFNTNYGRVFPEPEALLGEVPTLPGTDGKAKMSKSLGNCIYLSDSEKEVGRKVMNMYTDPKRIHSTDLGTVEGNPVFTYHDAFNDNKKEVEDLKRRYKKGKVGDMEVKGKLTVALNRFLSPIRQARARFEKEQGLVDKIIQDGSQKVKKEAQKTIGQVKSAMGL